MNITLKNGHIVFVSGFLKPTYKIPVHKIKNWKIQKGVGENYHLEFFYEGYSQHIVLPRKDPERIELIKSQVSEFIGDIKNDEELNENLTEFRVKKSGREIPFPIAIIFLLLSLAMTYDLLYEESAFEGVIVQKKLDLGSGRRHISDHIAKVYVHDKGVETVHIALSVYEKVTVGDSVIIYKSKVIRRTSSIILRGERLSNRTGYFILYIFIYIICLIPVFNLIFSLDVALYKYDKQKKMDA